MKKTETKIKAIRTFYSLSQTEFAKLFNVDQTAVSNWERGQNNIDITILQRIANHFNIPVEYILSKDYELRNPTSCWSEDNWEDYYNCSEAARDFAKFKIGKGYFPSIADHDSDDDAELFEVLESVRSRPEMRMLFSTLKDATKEDVERTVKIIEALKNNNG